MTASMVAGSFAGAGVSASYQPITPFNPQRGFNLSIWGSFVATIQLERSFDSGASWLPITAQGNQIYVFNGACSEVIEEPEGGVLYRLNCTAFTSGAANYRIGQ